MLFYGRSPAALHMGAGQRSTSPLEEGLEFGIWTDRMSHVLSPSNIIGCPESALKQSVFPLLRAHCPP